MDIFNIGKDEADQYIKEIKETRGLVIFRLKGPLDSSSTPILTKKMQEMHDKYASMNAIADFKEVTHVDTSAIAALVLILSDREKHGSKFGIINAPKEFANYLKVSKLESAVNIYKTEAAAIKALAKKKVRDEK